MNTEKLGEKNLFDTFDRIFKKHTEPLIEEYIGEEKEARSLLYTIKAGRNRFRSGLPFLLLENNKLGTIVGAISEISWAAILILDDIGDKTYIRRGKKSAWAKFGLLEASHAAALGFLMSEEIIKDNLARNKALLSSFRRALKLTLIAQIEQGNVYPKSKLANLILNNYIGKTSLGRWPLEASLILDYALDSSEKTKLDLFIREISVVAQIKNDLEDFGIGFFDEKYEPTMKDLEGKTVSYPIALFFSMALERERELFIKNYWGRKMKEDGTKKVISILNKYKVFDICIGEIENRLCRARLLIKGTNPKYRKTLGSWAREYKIII